MSAITDDEVVERVAKTLYDVSLSQYGNPWAVSWKLAQDDLQEEYRERARAAIQAHKEAYQTPYVDERHQGGNLLEFFILVSGRLHRAEEELAEARDIARINDYATLQGQYTRAAADLVEERQKNTNLNAELFQRQRQGQAAMNVLGIVRSDLYSSAAGSEIDPYHQDSRLDKFFDWLRTVITLEERVARDRGIRHDLAAVAEEFGVELKDDGPRHGRKADDDPLRPATFHETLGILREFSDALTDADMDGDGAGYAEGIRVINRHLNFAHGSGNAMASVEAIREKVGLCKGGEGIWARYCEDDCSNG